MRQEEAGARGQGPGASELRRALRALAAYDRLAEAPESVEARVLAGFRRARRRDLMWKGVAGSVAAAAVVGVVILTPWRAAVTEVEDPLADAHARAVMRGSGQIVESQEAGLPAAVEIAPEPARRVAAAPVERAAPREMVTEFFPLMDVMPPMERAEVWRVTVPASTLQTVGLPVNPERWSEQIQADVLVGEEGMARAIRFVRYEY